MRQVTEQYINELSYPDFVAFIGQINTPPGGQETPDDWIRMANINEKSQLLDLACSTGFSSRYIHTQKKCTAWGIDISEAAIDMAKTEATKIGVQDQLHYSVADATELRFGNERFSHILGGCNFSFIQLREKALKECHRVLEKAGCLCVSNFFYYSPPPVKLLDSIYDIINFRPDRNWTHAFWDNFFSTIFTKKRSKIKNLPIIDEADLKRIIKNIIYENSPHLKNYNDQIKRICFERLFRTRKLLNEHRKYQKYTVEVWEK